MVGAKIYLKTSIVGSRERYLVARQNIEIYEARGLLTNKL
jgi:hypothetical protein